MARLVFLSRPLQHAESRRAPDRYQLPAQQHVSSCGWRDRVKVASPRPCADKGCARGEGNASRNGLSWAAQEAWARWCWPMIFFFAGWTTLQDDIGGAQRRLARIAA